MHVALVVVEASTGSLRRYLRAAGEIRLTHECTCDQPSTFAPLVVEHFRVTPERRFKVIPDPTPPSGGPGGAPQAQKSA